MKRFLLLLTAVSAVASAAEKYAVYETDHFELITDGSRSRAQEILAQFERARSFFVKTLATKDPILKPRIVVFQKEKDYRDHASSAVSAAHYSALPQRDYIAIGPSTGDHDRRVTVHEYVHLLVRYTDTPMPLWMNEGVAELYSNIEQIKKTVRVGTPIPEHVFTVRNDWLPLSEVVDAGHDSKLYNRRQHVGPFYGISWALVHMLVLDTRYRNGFSPLGAALAGGATPEDAFRTVYKKSIGELENDLKSYIRGSSVNVVNYDVQFDKVDEKVAPRPITEYEWGVATAELIIGGRKYDQAAARLEALTKLQADRPEAWEALTFARWMGKAEGVEAAFAKARALGSTQPNLGFWAPAFTQDKAAAREALRVSVEKYPAFSDARIRLAEQNLFSGEFQAAFDGLKAIPKISNRQVPAWFPTFIQACWYLGKIEEARGAASQYVKLSATDVEKDRSKRLFAFAMKDPPKERVAPVFSAAEQTSFLPHEDDGDFGIDEDPNVIKFRRTPLTYATGALIQLECKEPAVLHFKSEAGVIKIIIDSPTALQVVNAADGKGELTCGDQLRPVKLGYYPKPGLADGATAVARSIEFLP